MNKVRKFPYSNIKRISYHYGYIKISRDFSIVYLEHKVYLERKVYLKRFSLPRARSRGDEMGMESLIFFILT